MKVRLRSSIIEQDGWLVLVPAGSVGEVTGIRETAPPYPRYAVDVRFEQVFARTDEPSEGGPAFERTVSGYTVGVSPENLECAA